MKPAQPRRGRPRGTAPGSAPATIQSLERALDVLDRLARGPGLTLSDLARDLGQSTATMHRVLATLEARQVVEHDPHGQTWHIGAMAFRLGSAFLRRTSLAERSRPAMRDIMQATGETANLGIGRDGEVVFIGQVETQETIRAFYPPGTVSPMHASGIGKALLACFDSRQIERFLRRHSLTRFTGRTITSPEDLRADLDRARARGWAYDDEEKAEGMRCVAAPIRDASGVAVAGVSVSGPTQRMREDRIEEIGALVREAALSISRSLGAEEDA